MAAKTGLDANEGRAEETAKRAVVAGRRVFMMIDSPRAMLCTSRRLDTAARVCELFQGRLPSVGGKLPDTDFLGGGAARLRNVWEQPLPFASPESEGEHSQRRYLVLPYMFMYLRYKPPSNKHSHSPVNIPYCM